LPDLLSKAVATTGNAESDVLSNARELENQSGMLRHAVDEFLARFARRERVTYASGKPGLTPWRRTLVECPRDHRSIRRDDSARSRC